MKRFNWYLVNVIILEPNEMLISFSVIVSPHQQDIFSEKHANLYHAYQEACPEAIQIQVMIKQEWSAYCCKQQ